MAKSRTNPFYVALLVVGTVFCLTAVAYGVMIVVRAQSPDSQHPLISFMAESGDRLLLIELAVLAVATFAAIGADGWFEGDPTDSTAAAAASNTVDSNTVDSNTVDSSDEGGDARSSANP
jgi:hypothetical protein